MPIDPRLMPLTPEERTAARLADLERRAARTEVSSLNRVAAFAKVSRASDTIGSGATTAVTFTTEDIDPTGMWTAVLPTQLTAATAGIYAVIGQANWGNNLNDGLVQTTILHNGSNTMGGQSFEVTGNVGVRQLATDHVWMNAGDYVELQLFQNTGANLAIFSAWLSAYYVGTVPP